MGTGIRQNTPPERGIDERNFDMIEEDPRGKENGPKSAQTDSGPNPNTYLEVGLMPRIVHTTDEDPAQELRNLAESFLEMTREQGERYARNRLYYSEMARRYGLTNQRIGDMLGITEARVRQILAGAR